MKPLVLKLLIVCMFALSFHGFGGDAHSAAGVSLCDETQVSVHGHHEHTDQSGAAIHGTCHFCEVSHSFLFVIANTVMAAPEAHQSIARIFHIPPDQTILDIVHPPNI